MPTSLHARRELPGRQGRLPTDFAELRRLLASPSRLTDGHRQRLLDLARRVARVQALGGEYRRVSLSDRAAAAAADPNAATA